MFDLHTLSLFLFSIDFTRSNRETVHHLITRSQETTIREPTYHTSSP